MFFLPSLTPRTLPLKAVSASASEDVPGLISHVLPLLLYGSYAVRVQYTILPVTCSLVS